MKLREISYDSPLSPALTGCEADAHRHGDGIAAAKAQAKAKPKKKAGVAQHPKVLDHVGLHVNEPPGTAELLFT
jgi:hypothetical protein